MNEISSEGEDPYAAYYNMTFEQADRAAHPNAAFWEESEWDDVLKAPVGNTNPASTAQSGRSPASANFHYLTDEKGNYIGDTGVTKLRKFVKGQWRVQDADYNPRNQKHIRPPDTWKHGANSAYRNRLRATVEGRFPWLRLCADGWKLERYAIAIFPSFRQHNKAPPAGPDPAGPSAKAANAVSDDDADGLSEEIAAPRSRKRKEPLVSQLDDHRRRRRRVEDSGQPEVSRNLPANPAYVASLVLTGSTLMQVSEY